MAASDRPALAGKAALVTGGGTGIGAATAIRLASMGASVAVSGRRPEPLRDVVARVEAAGGRAIAIPGDVGREEDAARMVEETAARFGRLDAVANCAGLVRRAPLRETTRGDFDELLAVNLVGAFLVCRAALPRLASPGGVIVNVATGAAIRAVPGLGAYGAAKAGLIYLTRVLALEAAPLGIRVAVVSPGSIETPIHETYLSPEDVADLPRQVASWTPLGRMGRADEVAAAIAWLVSSEASYVSGINLSVDGGSTAA